MCLYFVRLDGSDTGCCRMITTSGHKVIKCFNKTSIWLWVGCLTHSHHHTVSDSSWSLSSVSALMVCGTVAHFNPFSITNWCNSPCRWLEMRAAVDYRREHCNMQPAVWDKNSCLNACRTTGHWDLLMLSLNPRVLQDRLNIQSLTLFTQLYK